MKAIVLIGKILAFVLFLSFFSTIYSQSYTVSIEYGKQIDLNKFEFCAFITSKDSEFVLEAYQTALSFNQEIIGEGKLTFEYISGSSSLKNVPTYGIGIFSTDGQNELTFASNPSGSDTINNIKKCIGKFVLTNSKPFGKSKPDIKWNFEGFINTIIIESNATDVTNLATYIDLNYDNSLTAVSDGETKPESFQLNQNYPNPFNPTTRISYYLPKESSIKIQIYTLIGERIFEMDNDIENEGIHEFVWDAKEYASGIYILAMNADALDGTQQFSSVKKMSLLK